MIKIVTKVIFFILFLWSIYYTAFVETEKYRSNAVIKITNLSDEQSLSALGAALMPESSSAYQDSMLLEIYIRSLDLYRKLDTDFNLTGYYTSSKLDIFNRLYYKSPIPYMLVTQDNLLKKYNKDIDIVYDAPSSTFRISCYSADAKDSKVILESIIEYSAKMLNLIEQKNAKIVLSFLEKQESIGKKRYLDSIQNLITYQNEHNTMDPGLDAKSKSMILADLQGDLIKKQVEYKSQAIKRKTSSPTMLAIKSSIRQIEYSIKKLKNEISGVNKSNKLNVNVFDFELLKGDMDFNRKLYTQTLLKLEETKVNLNKKSKNLIMITNPVVPDRYSRPDKIAQTISIFIVLVFLYGIIVLVFSIIGSHRD